jgi:hypothetical protein
MAFAGRGGIRSSQSSIPRHPRRATVVRASSPYSTLGLPGRNCSIDEAKAAYRARVKLCHPDLYSGADEEELLERQRKTAELNDAYVAVLQDLSSLSGGSCEGMMVDFFDRCVGEPDFGFVNPLEVSCFAGRGAFIARFL